MKKLLLILTVGLLLGSIQLQAQREKIFYHPDDWVSYTNSRYVNDIALGFNVVYFATNGGILRYNTFQERWLDPLTLSSGMPESNVRRIAVDRMTDEIWIETSLTDAYWNPTFEEWYQNEPFPTDIARSQRPSPDGFPQLFVDHGYNYLPGGGVIGRDLLDYQINVTLADDADVIWVGIWGLGAGRVDLRRLDLALLPFGPYDEDAAAVAVVGDDIWLPGGGEGFPGSISRWRRDLDEWEYYHPRYEPQIYSDQFYAIAGDSKNVWFGTEVGLARYEIKRERFSFYSHSDGIFGDRVTAILPVRDNVIIGSERGVSVFDLKRDSIYSAVDNLIINREIRALAIDGKTIYAGTDFGIYTLQWGGSKWSQFRLDSPYLRDEIYDLQVDSGSLYALSDEGLAVIDLASGEYQFYDRNTSFENSDLRVLLVHEGIPWVGGATGLYRLNKETNCWYHYTTADGLLSNRVRDLAGEEAWLWIATDEGLTRFYWDDPSRDDWRR
ncbi:MAG: hypothetical protein ABIJ61_09990 [bacterium]